MDGPLIKGDKLVGKLGWEEYKNGPNMPSDEIMKNAFVVLLVGLMQEPFMAGDMKVILMQGCYNTIKKMDFPEDDVLKFKNLCNFLSSSFRTSNDFMG